MRRHDLGGDVLPLIPRRALHPVGRLLPNRRDPGPRPAVEHRSRLDPGRKALAFVLTDRDRRGIAPLRRRRVREEIEGAAQRLDRPGCDVGRSLRHFDTAEVHRVDEPVRLRAAPVVRRAVRKAVDGGADLRVVDGHLESAHDHVARPVVEAVRVPLLDGYAGKIVHDGRHAGNPRLLSHHRLRDEIEREDPGLLGDNYDWIEPPDDIQDDPYCLDGTCLERDRVLGGRETHKTGCYEIVAGGQTGKFISTIGPGDDRLAHAGTGHRHRDPGQGSAVCAHDRALNRSSCLCGGGRRGQERQEHGRDGEPAKAVSVLH